MAADLPLQSGQLFASAYRKLRRALAFDIAQQRLCDFQLDLEFCELPLQSISGAQKRASLNPTRFSSRSSPRSRSTIQVFAPSNSGRPTESTVVR